MTECLNNTTPKELSETDRAKLRKIRHVAFDMDGTIYMGSTLFPYTQETLKRLRENGIGYSFLTNNPTKSVKDYLAKLAGMGIEASEENMYTTSLAAIDYIRAHYPSARRLFLLGTPSMVSQFEKAGFEACADSADDRGIFPPLPRRMVGIAGTPLHRDQPGPRMPHRPADSARGLRLPMCLH